MTDWDRLRANQISAKLHEMACTAIVAKAERSFEKDFLKRKIVTFDSYHKYYRNGKPFRFRTHRQYAH